MTLAELTAKLRPEQREAARAACEHVRDARKDGRVGPLATLCNVSPTGTGKCGRPSTPVIRFTGEVTTFGEVRVGDELLAPDGTPRRVLGTVRGHGAMYRVTPVKGDPYFVTEDHVLSLRYTHGGKNGRDGTVRNLTVREYLKLSKTQRHLLKGWRSGPVEFGGEKKPLPVPPYVFGVWLGDGSTGSPSIVQDRRETPVIDAWVSYGRSIGATVLVRDKPGSAASQYTLSTGHTGRAPSRNALSRYLKATGLRCGKYIPHEFLTASREDRLELLAGLLDTDGSLSAGGFDYISVRRELANGVAFVARSLGLAASVAVCEKAATNSPTKAVGRYWRVYISGDCAILPTRLARKQAKPRRQKKDVLRVGITVEYVGEEEYAGFELDGDHLFLLGDFTVTHNSFIQGAVHRALNEAMGLRTYTTFPQIEIAQSVFEKCYGREADRAELEAHGFWTIKRLHNALMKGEVPLPDAMQHDETHHATDDTHETVWGIAGLPPLVGYTATDYRGTIVETQKFRAKFPKLHRVLTLKRAIELGRLALPSFDVWPLVNDELIDVTNGEFSTTATDKATEDVLPDLIERLCPWYGDGRWEEPTTIVCNSVKSSLAVFEALNAAGLPAGVVTGETSPNDRKMLFGMTLAREVALVQVRVVGEGVDLALRRMVDLAPTMSPVLWMQRVGRITRPWERQPTYIACNHNLARHAYLWHGCVPPSAMKTALEAWGKDFKPSRRFLARAIDVEGLGRFAPGAVPFAEGGVGSLYAMQSKDGGVQYAVLLHPLRPEPWFFGREIPLTGKTIKQTVQTDSGPIEVEMKERDYNAKSARWRKLDRLPDVKGMMSIKPGRLTPAQEGWWKRSAKHFGLDAEATITNREFQILPIIANSGVRFSLED